METLYMKEAYGLLYEIRITLRLIKVKQTGNAGQRTSCLFRLYIYI